MRCEGEGKREQEKGKKEKRRSSGGQNPRMPGEKSELDSAGDGSRINVQVMSRKAEHEARLQARLAAKERWKNRPGNRFTPAELEAMLRGPRVKIHPHRVVVMRHVK